MPDTQSVRVRNNVARIVGLAGQDEILRPGQMIEVRADIVNRINSGIEPPLRPATVARKKSSKPLVHTSQLKGAITSVVGSR